MMRRTFIRGVDGEESERAHPFEVHAHCDIECERQASGLLISLQVEADATASTGNKATKIFIPLPETMKTGKNGYSREKAVTMGYFD